MPGRAQLKSIGLHLLTQAEHPEYIAQCNCLGVSLLFISGLPVLMQLYIKYFMPNEVMINSVFLSDQFSPLFYSLLVSPLHLVNCFLASGHRNSSKIAVLCSKNTAIVTETKLKDSCHEQGQTESGKRSNKKREICYFSFPRGLRKTYKT